MLSGQEEKNLNEPQRACGRKPQLSLVLSKNTSGTGRRLQAEGPAETDVMTRAPESQQENMSTEQAPRGTESRNETSGHRGAGDRSRRLVSAW